MPIFNFKNAKKQKKMLLNELVECLLPTHSSISENRIKDYFKIAHDDSLTNIRFSLFSQGGQFLIVETAQQREKKEKTTIEKISLSGKDFLEKPTGQYVHGTSKELKRAIIVSKTSKITPDLYYFNQLCYGEDGLKQLQEEKTAFNKYHVDQDSPFTHYVSKWIKAGPENGNTQLIYKAIGTMPKQPGQTLDQFLLESLNKTTAVQHLKLDLIFLNTLTELKKLHKHRRVHGDLKSDNLLIDSEWNIKLIDFGSSMKTGSEPLNLSDDAWDKLWYTDPFRVTSTGPVIASDMFSLALSLLRPFIEDDRFQKYPLQAEKSFLVHLLLHLKANDPSEEINTLIREKPLCYNDEEIKELFNKINNVRKQATKSPVKELLEENNNLKAILNTLSPFNPIIHEDYFKSNGRNPNLFWGNVPIKRQPTKNGPKVEPANTLARADSGGFCPATTPPQTNDLTVEPANTLERVGSGGFCPATTPPQTNDLTVESANTLARADSGGFSTEKEKEKKESDQKGKKGLDQKPYKGLFSRDSEALKEPPPQKDRGCSEKAGSKKTKSKFSSCCGSRPK